MGQARLISNPISNELTHLCHRPLKTEWLDHTNPFDTSKSKDYTHEAFYTSVV